jgi:DNA-binding transcriptional LysR family regulator
MPMDWIDRIGHRLKLRDLHIVMGVAQHRSMGKAAAQLAISQPAVSKAIADVEHTLKVKLFDRTSSGVAPTPYGRALIKWGSAAFDDLRQGVKEIEHLTDPSTGELRLGCTEPMSSGFVPAIVDRLSRKYPKLVFHITQADPATLQARGLQSREIELAIGRIPGGISENEFSVEVLFQEPVFIASGRTNPLTRRRKVALPELMDKFWSVPPQGAIAHSALAEACEAAMLPMPRLTVLTYSLQFHYALMATGRYLGLVPGSMLHFAKRHGLAVVPVEARLQPGPAGIVTLKNRMLSPVAQLFIDTARQLAAPLRTVV